MSLTATNRITLDQLETLRRLEYYGSTNITADAAASLIDELYEHKRIVDREERRSACEAAIWRFYGEQERQPWMHDIDIDSGNCNNCGQPIITLKDRTCPKSNNELFKEKVRKGM